MIPQIIAAAILGLFVKSRFGGVAIYELLLGGLAMFTTAIIILRVEDVYQLKEK